MRHIDTDPDSGAQIHRLVDDPRIADNIYGEQPYSSPDGTRVAIRFYANDDADGGLAILDLTGGQLHPVLEEAPRFPAFHAWGRHLVCQRQVDGRLLLERVDWSSLTREAILDLTDEPDRLSYGTLSPDGRYYAVSAHRPDKSSYVIAFDLQTGARVVCVDTPERHFKHEQFALDGSHRILIQANAQDVSTVYLGILSPTEPGVHYIAADRPHTPRPTGHEAWVGTTDRVFFSTGIDTEGDDNIWVAGVDEATPTPAARTGRRYSHVSVSRCGRYWVCDAGGEEGVPIYAGSLATGRSCRLVVSGTQHSRQQWTHTHPYLTADNGWLIYTSTREGHAQVFGAKLPAGLLESLDD